MMALLGPITLLFLSLLVLYFLNCTSRLLKNYLAVCPTGLPIIVHPIGPVNPIWLLGRRYLAPPIRLLLPQALSAWTDRCHIGWTQQPKYASHTAVGSDVFWVVSPASYQLYIADAAAAFDVFRRCRAGEFIKDTKKYEGLNIFGPNVVGSNGKTWERHRRITVPPFNETVSELVWEETGRQVQGARKAWTAPEAQPVRETQEGCTRIALHVLTSAGLGKAYDFEGEQGHDERPTDRHSMSYQDALRTLITSNIVMILLSALRQKGWPEWATWGLFPKLARAKTEFQQYMEECVQEERRVGGTARPDGKENLVSVLVRSADRTLEEERHGSGKKLGLSDEEIYGNVFIYNIAGHDTTANTLHFALTLLALYPEWQDWLAEEIRDVVGSTANVDTLDYKQVFPKLTRCLALMVS
jgi:cytochrome P450